MVYCLLFAGVLNIFTEFLHLSKVLLYVAIYHKHISNGEVIAAQLYPV